AARAPRSPLFPYTTLFRSAPPAFSTYPRIHYMWTGAYVGLNAGISFAHVDWSSSVAGDALSGSSSSSSGVIGATIGYNLQVGNRSEEHTSELQSPDQLVCR